MHLDLASPVVNGKARNCSTHAQPFICTLSILVTRDQPHSLNASLNPAKYKRILSNDGSPRPLDINTVAFVVFLVLKREPPSKSSLQHRVGTTRSLTSRQLCCSGRHARGKAEWRERTVAPTQSRSRRLQQLTGRTLSLRPPSAEFLRRPRYQDGLPGDPLLHTSLLGSKQRRIENGHVTTPTCLEEAKSCAER